MDVADLRRRAREVAPDGFRRHPGIYWSDMLASAGITWLAYAGAAFGGGPWPLRLLLAALSALALYRAAYFVHEIAHFGRRPLPGFTLAWHLLVGLPASIPAFMASAHKDHHRAATYGGDGDPEYAPVASWTRPQIVGSVVLMVLAPPLLTARWLVVTPLSLVVPPLRRLAVAYLSTLAIAPAYRRPSPRGPERRAWLWAEAGAWLFATGVIAAVVARWIPWSALLWWWGIEAFALILNQLKTLVTHAFELEAAGPMALQVEDSITLGGTWLTEILAPLGNRYHAAHHLVPDVPYHDLPRVDRALAGIPAYERTRRAGWLGALAVLWRRASPAEAVERLA